MYVVIYYSFLQLICFNIFFYNFICFYNIFVYGKIDSIYLPPQGDDAESVIVQVCFWA